MFLELPTSNWLSNVLTIKSNGFASCNEYQVKCQNRPTKYHFWIIDQARILHNPHCMKRDPGRPGEPYKRSRNGLCRQGACQSLQIVNQARMRQSWTRTGRIDAGVSVPECVRPIPTRILPEAKKSRFLRGIESWHELDFTRRQTAKNGGFGAE